MICFQCSLGHFFCSPCRDNLPNNKCQACSGVVPESRSYGMEHGTSAQHGCTDMVTYYLNGEHKEACPHAPCFCPEPGCGFAGSAVALFGHFISQHKWPATVFKYYVPFRLPTKPGPPVLHGQDGSIFLLNVTSPELPLHGVSLVCVQPKASEPSRFGCSVGFSCWKGHDQLSSLETVPSSSLSDGLPKDCFCFVPKASSMLTITIDTELMHGDDSELEEEEDDDESCEEEEEEGGNE